MATPETVAGGYGSGLTGGQAASTYVAQADARKLFIPGNQFVVGSGAPSAAQAGSRYPGWSFANAADGTVRGSFMLPDWITNPIFTVLWCNNGAGSGNIYAEVNFSSVVDGATVASSDTLLYNGTLTALAQNLLEFSQMGSAQTVSPTARLFHVRFGRLGTNVADTLGNAIIFLGIVVGKSQTA